MPSPWGVLFKRIPYYSYDSYGIGHLQRMLALVEHERHIDLMLGSSQYRQPRDLGGSRLETRKTS
jgi:hypothetical protein